MLVYFASHVTKIHDHGFLGHVTQNMVLIQAPKTAQQMCSYASMVSIALFSAST